jgi:predicted transcriptional regulator
MNMTTKQYYTRISGLMDAGLIKRHKGKYSLTLLGKVVYDTQMTVAKSLAYYWKLRTIESIEMSTSSLPKEEIRQMVDALIDDNQVKDILLRSLSVTSSIPSVENGSSSNVET